MTMTNEQRDGLESAYLVALMQRDAKVWHVRNHIRMVGETEDADDPETSIEFRRVGNPIDQQARADALEAGDTHYQRIAPCRNCGGREFYVNVNVCVVCTKARDAKRASHKKRRLPAVKSPSIQTELLTDRIAARSAGHSHYRREQPCRKCGGFIFRVHNHECHECAKESGRQRRARLRQSTEAITSPA